jgi:hypothetical protein
MGVHVANGYIRTSNKGVLRQVFNFAVGGTGAVGTVIQAGANFVTSVTKTATGIYTVQLNKLYPVRLIFTSANIATPAGTDALITARIDADSYSATAGTFIVLTSGPQGAALTAQVAADPVSGSLVNVELVYVDQTTGIAS